MTNKKIIKKIVILICILIFISIIIATIFLLNKDKINEKINNEIGDAGEEIDYDTDKSTYVEDQETFFTVESCVNQYLNILNNNNSLYYSIDENGNYVKIITDEEINGYIYNMLSKKYINEKDITKNNVGSKVLKFKDKVIFTPLKMKKIEDVNIGNYLVSGFITDSDGKYLKDLYIIINLNKNNNCYSVYPIDDNSITNINSIKFEYNGENIVQNDDNEYENTLLTYEQLSKKYFEICKRLMISKPETLYNDYLDEEYKNEKFLSYDVFEQYINRRIDDIKTSRLDKYNVSNFNGVDNAVISLKDQNGRIYLINEDYIMNFKVSLDNYTILKDTILEKYNNNNEEKKILTNIDRILEAINYKDYEFIYKRINETYKNNNFKDIQSFIGYINNYTFNYNNMTISSVNKQNDVYIYSLNIINKDNNQEIKNINLMIRLKEGTDFEISFGTE